MVKNNLKSRVISIVTLLTLFFALNASGALAGFWRTLNLIDKFSSPTNGNESQYGYGYGTLGWGYGYGYGYGDVKQNEGYYYSKKQTGTEAYSGAYIVNASTIREVSAFSGSNVVINAPAKFVSGNVSVVLPAGLEISASSGSLSSLLSSISLTGTTNKTVFGIPNTKLIFSKPIKLEIEVGTSLNEKTLKLLVKHYGDTTYNTSGLTTSAGVCNTTNGTATPSQTTAVVSSGKVTVYTCAASEFITEEIVTPPNNNRGSSGGSSKDYCPNGDTSGSYYDNKCIATVTSTGTTTSSTGTTNETTALDDVQVTKDPTTGVVTVTKADGTKISFSDVSNTFATTYIAKLAALGIVAGYSDGTFRPENKASRAEYLKIVLRAMDIDYSNVDTSKLTFADVDKNSWVAKVVVKAGELKLIDTTNKNFRPDAQISRAEAMKMLINAAGIQVQETAVSSFADVTGWAVKYVQKAKDLGIVNGQEINGKVLFRPADNITRAEVSKIVVKTMELK